jgi:hypothetical protein
LKTIAYWGGGAALIFIAVSWIKKYSPF